MRRPTTTPRGAGDARTAREQASRRGRAGFPPADGGTRVEPRAARAGTSRAAALLLGAVAATALGCSYEAHLATSLDDAGAPDASASPDAGVPSAGAVILALAFVDLDDDGRDDLAVLDVVADRATPTLRARVRVAYGTAIVPSVLEAVDRTWLGAAFPSRVERDGRSVPVRVAGGLAPGDLDGDGIADLAVGLGFDDGGAVRVLHGSATRGGDGALDASPGIVRADGGGFGHRVAFAGDLAGDGRPELAVRDVEGSRTWWIEPPRAGEVRVAASDAVGGGAVASVGDVDEDGRPDLAVLAADAVEVHLGPTAPNALATSLPDVRVPGENGSDAPTFVAGSRVEDAPALVTLWRRSGDDDALRVVVLEPDGPRVAASRDLPGTGCTASVALGAVLVGCPTAGCRDGACGGVVESHPRLDTLGSPRRWHGEPVGPSGDALGGAVALGDFDGDGRADAAFSGRGGAVRLVSDDVP